MTSPQMKAYALVLNVFTDSGNLLSLKPEHASGQQIGFWDSSATAIVLFR